MASMLWFASKFAGVFAIVYVGTSLAVDLFVLEPCATIAFVFALCWSCCDKVEQVDRWNRK